MPLEDDFWKLLVNLEIISRINTTLRHFPILMLYFSSVTPDQSRHYCYMPFIVSAHLEGSVPGLMSVSQFALQLNWACIEKHLPSYHPWPWRFENAFSGVV